MWNFNLNLAASNLQYSKRLFDKKTVEKTLLNLLSVNSNYHTQKKVLIDTNPEILILTVKEMKTQKPI